jgi:phosphate/sulfate permease
MDTATLGQTSTKDGTSTSAIMTSARWMYDPTSSRINWSMRVSKQGVELIVMSVVGGSLAFIVLVLLHRLISRSFQKKNEQSRYLSPVSLANSFSREESSTRISDLAEVSHFSIES